MNESFDFGGQIVWTSSPEYIQKAHLTRFMQNYTIDSFADLITRSSQDVAWFNEAILSYLDIQFYKPYTQIVDLSAGIAWPRWCVDGFTGRVVPGPSPTGWTGGLARHHS